MDLEQMASEAVESQPQPDAPATDGGVAPQLDFQTGMSPIESILNSIRLPEEEAPAPVPEAQPVETAPVETAAPIPVEGEPAPEPTPEQVMTETYETYGSKIVEQGASLMQNHLDTRVPVENVFDQLMEAAPDRTEQMMAKVALKHPDAFTQFLFGDGMTAAGVKQALAVTQAMPPERIESAVKLLEYAEAKAAGGVDIFEEGFDLDDVLNKGKLSPEQLADRQRIQQLENALAQQEASKNDAILDTRAMEYTNLIDAPITMALEKVDLSDVDKMLSDEVGFPVSLKTMIANEARSRLSKDATHGWKYKAALEHALAGNTAGRDNLLPALANVQTRNINALLKGVGKLASAIRQANAGKATQVGAAPRIIGGDQGTNVQRSDEADFQSQIEARMKAGMSAFEAARSI